MERVEIIIRAVTLADIPALQEVGRQTFHETFAPHNTDENMKKHLEEGFTEEKLRHELSNNESQFYFAVREEKVIGYLKLNLAAAQTEQGDRNALEIERIYVIQEHLGKRVGQLLYEKAMEIATQAGVDYVWLGVWEKNQRAIYFYKKNGFVAFDQHIFKLGDDEQTDIMMKKTIKAE